MNTVAISLFGSYFVLVAMFGLAGAWTRPLNWDESTFYLPAFKWVWNTLPRVSLDYPLQGLPTTLYIQALTFGASGQSVVAVRLLSSISMLAVAGVLFFWRPLAPSSSLGKLQALGLLCNPFLFWNTFTVKSHAVGIAALLLGVVAWRCIGPRTKRGVVITAFVGLAIAGTSSQLALAVCAGLLTSELLAAFRARRVATKSRLLAPALPLLAVLALFAFWGRFSPPAYGTFLKESLGSSELEVEVGRFSHPLPCVALLLISVGAWLSPMILQFRRRQMLTLVWLAWPLAAVLVEVSGLYRPGGSFLAVAAGPVSTALRSVSGGSQWLLVVSAGFLAALGMLLLLPARTRPENGGATVQIMLFCCLGAAAGVPYLFESYSVYAVIGLGALLLDGAADSRICRFHTVVVAGAGVLYGAVKLFGG
jgi:hypothetical protein